MLIIPIEQKLDSNRPPVATVLLIILNCLVFFGYQAQDYVHMDEAFVFYENSGLLEYESDLYAEYLKTRDPDLYKEYTQLEEAEYAIEWIVPDAEFAHYLNHDYFIQHTDAGLAWMDARAH